LRHAELVHQLRSVHAGLAVSTDLLLDAAQRCGDGGPTAGADLDCRRLLLLQSREVAHLGRLLDDSGVPDPGRDLARARDEPLVDLAEIVDLAVGIARLHGQDVTWPGTSVHHPAPARPTREVLQVVLENARRHAAGARVDLSVTRDGDGVRVRVHDEGPGLGSARSGTRGSGLGLRIATEAAEDKGARLEVEESDHGACFVLVLPTRRGATGLRSQAGGTPWSARRA
jgi:signal transduction histidine kinase